MDRPVVEQPAAGQVAEHVAEHVAEQRVAEPSVVAQSVVREHAVVEIARNDFAPAATANQRAVPEPVLAKSEVQPVAPQPQMAPVRKMDPVTVPSDLVMIESRSKGPATYQEPEAPRPARTPRPRYQPSAIVEEPLQQVETGKQQSVDSDAA